MRANRLILLSFLAAAIGGKVFAQDVSYTIGVDVTSNYVTNGVSDSNDKPAIQPYFEVAIDGFYFGTWMSTVDLGTDDLEIDLYGGYRTALGDNMAIDIGYARYLYNDTGDCCGEFKLQFGFAPTETFGIDLYSAYDPSAKYFNNRITMGYVVTDDLGLSATYGYRQANKNKYWHAGASYAFNDRLSASLRYHDATMGFQGLIFSLSLSNSQTTLRRLFGGPSITR